MEQIQEKMNEIIRMQGEIIKMQAEKIAWLEKQLQRKNSDDALDKMLETIKRRGPVKLQGEIIPPKPEPAPDAIEKDMEAIDARRKKR